MATKQSRPEAAERIKNRYYSLKQDGSEIYAETMEGNPNLSGIEFHTLQAIEKVKAVRTALPAAKWSITIEEEVTQGDRRFYRGFNPETGERFTSK